jgi:SpoVK/Ycf46/Vps4 family AAA+-type ATPase
LLSQKQKKHWNNVDFESLAKLSNGFAPADIQAVLLTAVNEAYNRKARSAVVTQQHLEDAVVLVKFRKQNEEEE